MIPDQYKDWPVVMSINKAAHLLGIDRKTLTRNRKLIDNCTVVVGDKPKVIRDRLLKELKLI